MFTQKIYFFIILVVLGYVASGCGTSPPESNVSHPNVGIKCLTIDKCTNANVPGYYCGMAAYGISGLPSGYNCVVTKQDYQTDPNCASSSCVLKQGPGPAAL